MGNKIPLAGLGPVDLCVLDPSGADYSFPGIALATTQSIQRAPETSRTDTTYWQEGLHI